MIIIGKEHLDSNNYSKISIKDYEIIISNNSSKNGKEINNENDEDFKKLCDYEIVMKIVEKYLWNNTVCYISDNEVRSTNDIKLKFNTLYDYNIKIKALDKYITDRMYNLYHCDVSVYEVKASNKVSSYKDNSYTIKLRNGKVTYEELVFLTKLLDNVFNDETVGLRFVDNKLFVSNINCEGKYVVFKNINENNTVSICDVVSYHNKNVYDRRNNKKLIKEMK